MSASPIDGDELTRSPRGPSAELVTELVDGPRGPEIRTTLHREGRRTGIYTSMTIAEARLTLTTAERRLEARRARAPAGLELVREAIAGAMGPR